MVEEFAAALGIAAGRLRQLKPEDVVTPSVGVRSSLELANEQLALAVRLLPRVLERVPRDEPAASDADQQLLVLKAQVIRLANQLEPDGRLEGELTQAVAHAETASTLKGAPESINHALALLKVASRSFRREAAEGRSLFQSIRDKLVDLEGPFWGWIVSDAA